MWRTHAGRTENHESGQSERQAAPLHEPQALTGGDSGAVLGLIAAAAKHLGVPVLVQGIETRAGAAVAQFQGCAVGQGYLFGRPDPRTECFRLDGALARASSR